MPIYEYECAKCRKVHEIWQKMSDQPETKCPACGGKLSRLISPSGFALKGTGWYKTDYERKSSKPAKKDAEGSGSSESKKDGSGDKKDGGSGNKAQAA